MIHNSSNCVSDNLYNIKENDLLDSLRLNAVSPSILTQNIIPYMNSNGKSSILFIGSTLSEKAVPNKLSYVTSKHAMIGLMKGITQDLFGKNIHTCVINPGFTNTKMLQNNIKGNENEFNEFIHEFVSLKRLINPNEIAQFVYHVSQTPIVNGAVLNINGGQKET